MSAKFSQCGGAKYSADRKKSKILNPTIAVLRENFEAKAGVDFCLYSR
jgi:hypothetical protein